MARHAVLTLAVVGGAVGVATALAPSEKSATGKMQGDDMPADGAKPAQPTDDFISLPGDPRPMRLKIVDAFKVDQSLSAEKITALKQAAKKPPATRPTRARRPMKTALPE
jgi:hypothetical protein